MIELEVAPEISTLTGETVPISGNVDAPVFAKRSARTKVVVPSAKTVVIGGLMEDQETENVRKIPILGSIPLAGALFRRTITNKNKTELLIFLTPAIVENGDQLVSLSDAEFNRSERIRRDVTDETLSRYLSVEHEDVPPAPVNRRPSAPDNENAGNDDDTN